MTDLSDAALAHLRGLPPSGPPETERYAVLDELGRGGMGVVYRARDRHLDREVALKVVADDLPAGAQDRLRREAETLAALEHPGIVPVHDLGVLPDGRPFYVMKLVRGETLAARTAAGLGRGEALRLFTRICETVAFAHAQGVIHRDLTPRNVMLGPFGDVLVLDWGLAKLTTSPRAEAAGGAPGGGHVTGAGSAVGTPGYMAPEQAAGAADVDARADVYALGRILGGLVASDGDEVPAPLRSIVARASAPVPDQRYPGAAELSRDVVAYLDGAPVAAHREHLLERLARVARRHRVALSLIGVYLIVRLLLLVFLRR